MHSVSWRTRTWYANAGSLSNDAGAEDDENEGQEKEDEVAVDRSPATTLTFRFALLPLFQGGEPPRDAPRRQPQ